MLRENMKLTGQLSITLKGPDGQIKDRRVLKNLIVNAGKAAIASGTALSGFTHIGIGTGTTAPAAGDTALQSELSTGYSRALSTQSNPSSYVRRYVGTFGINNPTSPNPVAITEAGMFTASTGGTMLCRQTFAAMNKYVNDTLEITWEITVS
jgi:hypothetical protein